MPHAAEEWFSGLFAVWLLLTVISPEDVYRTFFHALIYPLTLFLFLRRNAGRAARRDEFMMLFVTFCGYAAISTWFVGGGPEDRDIQASRWSVEAALGMLAFFFWALSTVRDRRAWGLWFLIVALTGSSAGLLMMDPALFLESRARGLGAMSHPIQGASIASVFLAVGLFLMLAREQSPRPADIVFMSLATIIVWCFVALTLSRGPLAALTLYLVTLGVVLFPRQKGTSAACQIAVIVFAFAVLIQLSVGWPQILDQLVSRGVSYRLEIWWAYLSHPPESFFLGNGLGFDFRQTGAANALQSSARLDIAHPHNIWLGAFSETGLLGLLLQAGLLILPAVAVFRSRMPVHTKLHLQAILALFCLLTFSDEYTLLRSVHAIWLFGWLPLILPWVWARYFQQSDVASNEKDSENP